MLVHCVGGVSRSPTVCIAYFVLMGYMTVDKAYAYIKNRRPVIGPNFSFMGELRMLEEKIQAEHVDLVPSQCVVGGSSSIGGSASV